MSVWLGYRKQFNISGSIFIFFYIILSNLIFCFILFNLKIFNVIPSSTSDVGQNEQPNRMQQFLAESNENWKRSTIKRYKAEKFENFPEEPISPETSEKSYTALWDYFYPSFDCPYTTERVGRAGDGGKWICGIKQLQELGRNCTIYSFGISFETTFEEELLKRTQCTVRMFDHTYEIPNDLMEMFPGESGITNKPKSLRVPDRTAHQATFAEIGLESTGTETESLKSLKTLMNMYNDNFIDILKIDIEGTEWVGMTQIILDFPDQLPFAQLLVEVHLDQFSPPNRHFLFRYWWYLLEKAGLRAFSTEPNLLTVRFMYAEYSFLNIRNGPYKLNSGPDFESVQWTYLYNETESLKYKNQPVLELMRQRKPVVITSDNQIKI